jgi:hypothetical protein
MKKLYTIIIMSYAKCFYSLTLKPLTALGLLA